MSALYDIEYTVLGEQHVDEGLDLLIEVMYKHEPVLQQIVKDPAQLFRDLFKPLRGVFVEQGLCSVAIDKANNKIVGIRITEDYAEARGAPELAKENEGVEAFLELWDTLDKKWESTKEEPIVRGKWAHWMGVAVHPNYGKQGIAQKLYEHNINLLKSKNYLGAICENTSAFSSISAERAGVKLLFTQSYAEYPFNGGFPLSVIPSPHTHFALREIIF